MSSYSQYLRCRIQPKKNRQKVVVLCCDTTSWNMGQVNGASTLLQQMLEKDLLYFPCRHHIFEIVLKSVFDLKISDSSVPNVLLFQRFDQN